MSNTMAVGSERSTVTTIISAVAAFCAAVMLAGPILAEQPRPIVSTLRITRQHICPGTISPYQHGQFIVYLCGLTPSIFAEKVFDGGFEGVPEYKVAFRKQTDRIEQP